MDWGRLFTTKAKGRCENATEKSLRNTVFIVGEPGKLRQFLQVCCKGRLRQIDYCDLVTTIHWSKLCRSNYRIAQLVFSIKNKIINRRFMMNLR